MGTKSKKPKESPIPKVVIKDVPAWDFAGTEKTDGQKTSEYKMMKSAKMAASWLALALGIVAILGLFVVFTKEQVEALIDILPPMIGAIVLLTAGIFGAGMYCVSRGIAKANNKKK
jgi:lysylphosphatidylglycerol synthetase-like protein (DUF2156 family)